MINNDLQSATSESDHHTFLRDEVRTFLFDKLEQSSLDYQSNSADSDTNNDIQVKVRNIDKRIVVPRCASGFNFELGSDIFQQTNQSIKVSCIDKPSWYLFVHASVAVMQDVVVSRDNLSPGSLLSKRNLEVISIDKNRLKGSVFSDIAQVAGARIKRRMRSGNIIDDRMLCFVCKGDRVSIAASRGGLSVKVFGVAEQDGVLGDTIQVRNISSDKLVYGRVTSTSEVQVSI
jgi:flagella basal body P-ring formation protein FlgA